MSKIFYDDLVDLSKVEKKINKVARSEEEKHELWKTVDEIVHHRVMGCILRRLPREHHEDFLDKFRRRPHDEGLFEYLKEKIKDDIKFFIKEEALKLGYELLGELSVGLMREELDKKKE